MHPYLAACRSRGSAARQVSSPRSIDWSFQIVDIEEDSIRETPGRVYVAALRSQTRLQRLQFRGRRFSGALPLGQLHRRRPPYLIRCRLQGCMDYCQKCSRRAYGPLFQLHSLLDVRWARLQLTAGRHSCIANSSEHFSTTLCSGQMLLLHGGGVSGAQV